MPSSLDRRQLFQASATAIVVGGLNTALATSTSAAESAKGSLVQDATVLFQGDSITDAGRDRKRGNANDSRSLGHGYPVLVAGGLLKDYAGKNIKVFNRGISGHKVPDLANRWQADCIDIKPDVLSILIGVNDIWHKLNGRYDGTVETYETGYKALLEDTLEKLPNVRIAICEPFVLRCGAVGDHWFPEFTQRLEAARRVADELSLERVAFQDMFDEAIKVAPPQYWAADGVHPTLAGHTLMAETWRQTLGL
ncbi:SGNH/GDSL hydrolase family protein [Aporhodopirellula aestuarii]|uniref:SGNH/GDSL hydrolase family protein n=1 Tax=Aporhodopirellula aestuarii TaxID=2950107 RepID=A0ABT0TZQ0_9BACT|nr:SGNH/GDSL hydrolase family protein [Aporhodopirellula aestuarii]MCM2370084.1 SGNH/GDSL hydrolase family protein [Aporhodopirellula aestuarii]